MKNYSTLQNLLNDEELGLISSLEEKVPVLFNEKDENNLFCINAKELWEQLEKPQGKFTTWIGRKFLPYGYIQDKDFKITNVDPITHESTYYLTIEMAKGMAIIDTTDIGKQYRLYFLLMEKVMFKIISWGNISSKKNRIKELKSAFTHYFANHSNQNDNLEKEYRREIDRLSILATGLQERDVKKYIASCGEERGIELLDEYNSYLIEMYKMDSMLLTIDYNSHERYEALKMCFDNTFPKITIFSNELTKDQLEEKRNNVILGEN